MNKKRKPTFAFFSSNYTQMVYLCKENKNAKLAYGLNIAHLGKKVNPLPIKRSLRPRSTVQASNRQKIYETAVYSF